MSVLGTSCFWLFTRSIPAIQTSPITVCEIYFLGVLIPFSVGSFLVFAFGDFVCLKLKLYKENQLFRFDSSQSIESLEQIKLNVTRTTVSMTVRESEKMESVTFSDRNKDISPSKIRNSWN